MAITTLSMVLTVFVLNLHHVTDRPVPRWVKTLVLVYMARMLGIQFPGDKKAAADEKQKKQTNKRKTLLNSSNHLYRRASVRIESEGDERTAIIELQPTTSASAVNGGRGVFSQNYGSINQETSMYSVRTNSCYASTSKHHIEVVNGCNSSLSHDHAPSIACPAPGSCTLGRAFCC